MAGARQAAEDRAKGYYELMDVQYARSVSQKTWLAAKAYGWATMVTEDLKRHDSPILFYEKQRLMYAGHFCAKKYSEALSEMNLLNGYYDSHQDFASDSRYAEVAMHKLDCFMHLHEHEEGRKCAEMCQKYFWPGSQSWHNFMELYFLLSMLTAEYTKAAAIVSEAESDPNFAILKDFHKEKWRLYKDYLNYANGIWETGKTFGVIKFLNNYETLTKDKSGHNAAIYILAWCMQVRYNKSGATGSREALKKYRMRHLAESQTIG